MLRSALGSPRGVQHHQPFKAADPRILNSRENGCVMGRPINFNGSGSCAMRVASVPLLQQF
jgi:hypothetical protein